MRVVRSGERAVALAFWMVEFWQQRARLAESVVVKTTNHRANLVGAAAFFIGLLGFQAYAVRIKEESQGGRPVSVLIVTRDLEPGALLSPETLAKVDVPADYLDERRIRESEKENLMGVPVQNALKAGDGLIWGDLADGKAHQHLAALVLPGRRAYSIDAGANPLGRLLRVGDHVDVLVEASGRSEILLERVLVLAVGGKVESEELGVASAEFGGKGVTLSVTSAEAEKLFSAESRGDLRLILRNPEDLRESSGAKDKSEQDVRASLAKAEKTQEIEHVR